jgi:hypothetical protein
MDAEARLVTGWIAGMLAIFVLLLALDLLGVPWSRTVLLPLLAALAVLGWRRGRKAPKSPWQPPGWGDAVAAAAFLVFLVCTVLLWNLHPDFIYHWGIKGEKLHLAEGLDFDFLASPWNVHVHPDYPNLVPVLFAATAALLGGFHEVPMALWSALFYAATVLMGRQLLRRTAATDLARQGGLAVLALMLTMFGVGYQTAGGADWLMTLTVMAAAVFFTARPSASQDLPVGLLAAFAAAAKIEGVPLAVCLIAVHLTRRWRHGKEGEGPTMTRGSRPGLHADAPSGAETPLPGRGGGVLGREVAPSPVAGEGRGEGFWEAVARTALPAALVVGVWAWQVISYGLFQPGNTGAFDWGRASVVFPELWRSLLSVNWHGLTFCLAALPVLLAARRTRAIAAVVCLQLTFYVYVYLSASVDPRQYVITSAARLFFHLVPAVMVLAIAAADRWSVRVLSPAEALDG